MATDRVQIKNRRRRRKPDALPGGEDRSRGNGALFSELTIGQMLDEMVEMAQTINTWLDYRGMNGFEKAYLVGGLMNGVLEEVWRSPASERPRQIDDMLTALDRMGALLGGMLVVERGDVNDFHRA